MHAELMALLNAPQAPERLDALRALRAQIEAGAMPRPRAGGDVNNHIHTTYSFSPYSPTKAIWMAYNAGLCTAGIVDHDSISGAREFIEAGNILAMPTTIGYEQRVAHTGTALGTRRTNNPDQVGISYITVHGVPHTQIDTLTEFLAPVCAAREKRNRAMVANINAVCGTALDYEADVVPLSQRHEGGSITERHLLYALGLRLIAEHGKGAALLRRLRALVPVAGSAEAQLSDPANPYYEYDLLGLLKGHLVEKVYVPSGPEECPDIREVVRFAGARGMIATYPYLGDVARSVTGDKKAQVFEDAFLDELFEELAALGFHAISYMPSRNTMAQVERVRALCDRYDMLQISGEDINTPRQSFVCDALRDP
ncbi:MAG: PHP domain-containing protein, partial [Clostridia bacterium]|nr:PHP domain-containing protein [Clostridia bacterium]